MQYRTPIETIAEELGVHPTTVLSRERGGIIRADDLPSVAAAYGITPKQLADKLREMMP